MIIMRLPHHHHHMKRFVPDFAQWRRHIIVIVVVILSALQWCHHIIVSPPHSSLEAQAQLRIQISCHGGWIQVLPCNDIDSEKSVSCRVLTRHCLVTISLILTIALS